MWEKVIVHSYFDNYYAQIEEIKDPSLKEKEFVVCNQQHQIISMNLKAEACGMKKGVSLKQARLQCPKLIALYVDKQKAYAYQKQMIDMFYEYSDNVKILNMEEIIVDLSSTYLLFNGNPELIAYEIQKRIDNELGLSVSLGVSFCEEMAKLCHRHRHDIMVVGEYHYRSMMDSLFIESLIMLPTTLKKKLNQLGFLTLGDLLLCSNEQLSLIFKNENHLIMNCLYQLQNRDHQLSNLIYHMILIKNEMQLMCQNILKRLTQSHLSKSQPIHQRACYKS